MDKENQLLTKKDFKEILLEALKDQSQSIIEAVDFQFENAKKDRAEIKQDIKDIQYTLRKIERRVIFIEDVITRHTKEIKGISQELKKIRNELEKLADARKTKTDDIKVVQLAERVGKLELAMA